MKLTFTILSFLLFLTVRPAQAQIADGNFVPNFEATDINGNKYELYDLLSQGYKVVIDVSATWCGPCWSYHQDGALKELYQTYGPDGTQEVMVLFIEGDDTTTNEDLVGTGGSTLGDWTAGTPYPIFDDAGYIGNLLEIAYYPTIFTVCGDGKIYESGRLSAEGHYDFAMALDCQPTQNDVGVGIIPETKAICDGSFSTQVSIINVGLDQIQQAEVTLEGCDNCPLTQSWSGELDYFNYDKIEFPIVESSAENVELTFSLSTTDDNNANNETALSVSLEKINSTTTWTMELLTDCYPAESSWDIYDEDGNIVASGGNFVQEYNTYIDEVELPSEGCYSIAFNDSYGDGLFGTSAQCTADGNFKCYSDTGEMMNVGGSEEFTQKLVNSTAMSPSSIDDLGSAQLSLTPNPATDMISLDMTGIDATDLVLEIVDMKGQAIYTKNYSNIAGQLNERIDVSGLTEGTYIMSLTSSTDRVIEKVIIQR